MRKFQLWLTLLCETTIGLFEDSIRCFKHEITRPAYFLAYQGMIRQLSDVIVYGCRPVEFSENDWNAIL